VLGGFLTTSHRARKRIAEFQDEIHSQASRGDFASVSKKMSVDGQTPGQGATKPV
jgi:hypothetical protein